MERFPGFTDADFDTFAIPSVDGRMAGIIAGPRPKLEALGRELAPTLSALVGHELYPIVARHQRRKVNPPNDTWVAWGGSRRGYKMLPHFQVGLWESHGFIQAGVIYEAEGRAAFAENLLADLPLIRSAIPPHFRWLEDYTQPQGILHKDMRDEDFHRIATRLTTRRMADCMVGLSIDRAEVVRAGTDFATMAAGVMERLLPIYRLAQVSLVR